MAICLPCRDSIKYIFILTDHFNQLISIGSDLEVQPLKLVSGTIWTALNIDYPGHSFSHLGAFHGISLIIMSTFHDINTIQL